MKQSLEIIAIGAEQMIQFVKSAFLTVSFLGISLIVCLIPISLFAENSWIFWGLDEAIASFDCERRSMAITFETQQPVSIECSYPILAEQGRLIEIVNQKLESEAKKWFDRIVQEERSSNEIWEEEYGVSYELFPVFFQPDLISIFGSEFQGRGGHGCSYYEGKTYWQTGDLVLELNFDDLFICGSDYRNFILLYCENAFKTSGYGYYSCRTEFLPELSQRDLDTFVLTNKGLMIIFSAYKVGGWADGPDTITIPYSTIKQFIDPSGPLKRFL